MTQTRTLFVPWFTALVALGCSESDPRCTPCESMGCPNPYVCSPAPAGTLGVCIFPDETAAACGVATDAGQVDGGIDAGPEDTGPADMGPQDAGPDTRCPETTTASISWAFSEAAQLCFTVTEVTALQFDACVNASCTANNLYSFNFDFRQCTLLFSPPSPNLPMNCIRVEAARDFCAFVGGRLPTASGWQAEASAGGTRTYPWGNEAPDCTRANYAAQAGPCQNDTLTPPCALPAGNSVSGLCDLAGNAGEILEDSSGGSVRLAGGSIDTGSAGLRADGEVQRPDGVGTGFAGFRCVKDPQ